MNRFHLSAAHAGDLQSLIDSRLLIQANSGGGKSWCIRRLLEQTHGHVQHLVIDPEGEFATLREKFDYVLAAKNGGDTAADPRTARLLAERLLELGVSAILDIYELKAHERIRFVHEFLDALVNAPKTLWHPALVVVDEAHVFCPESSKAESAGAVIDLATRGRKRGFCAVLATQRLSKLAKDAAAECNNKLIGRTGLDVDVKRAADELGLTKDRWRELRELDPGEFFAFGPAISREVIKVKIGPVVTRHPKAGARLAAAPPPPTAKVKALLPKLSDLPAEVQERQKTLEDLRTENQQLRRDLRSGEKRPLPSAKDQETTKKDRAELARLRKAVDAAMKFLVSISMRGFDEKVPKEEIEKAVQAATAQATKIIERRFDDYALGVQRIREQASRLAKQLKELETGDVAVNVEVRHNPPYTVAAAQRPPRGPGNGKPPVEGLSTSQQRILDSLCWLEGVGIPQADKAQVALLADQSPTSGGYFNNLGKLRSSGLIEYPAPGVLSLTPAGRESGRGGDVPSTSVDLQEQLYKKLSASQSEILRQLIAVYPDELAKGDLAEKAGQSATSGGYFNNLGRLRSLGLIDYPGPGRVVAKPVLFLDGA